MSDKIEPALSPEEWADAMLDELGEPSKAPSPGLVYELSYIGWLPADRRIPAVIAILNAALPDSNPRKFTRYQLAALRFAASVGGSPHVDNLIATLESYLPPEGT